MKMAHIDYVKKLVESMGDREFCTREIAEMMVDYWTEQRVRSTAPLRTAKAYTYLSTLARWGVVVQTRLDSVPGSRAKVAFWKKID